MQFLSGLGCRVSLFSIIAISVTQAQTTNPSATPSPGGLSLQVPANSATPGPAPDSEGPKPTPSSAVENSVVKVFSSMRAPDLSKPWAKQAPAEVTGSGVIIDGKRILTNAHVVAFSSQVQVQANQAGDKLAATVEAMATGIDLAILKLEDEKFFDTHAPLPRAEKIPEIKDAVMVYGYPTGGTSLSATKGIVSRIEFTPYNFPDSGLRIQLDAAINPGNSGGPAVIDDKLIGIAFSHLGGAENIGYIIPSEEIELFLRAITNGKYAGKPGFYEEWQTLENSALRSFLKIPDGTEGVVIRHPLSDDASYPLKKWDVITRIGDTAIDDQGMIKIGPNLRVQFPYMVQHSVKDGKVPMTVLRAQKEMRIDLPAPTNYPLALPDWGNNYPSYFILGPLAFAEATAQIMGSMSKAAKGMEWLTFLTYTGSPIIRRTGDKEEFSGERLVYVSSPFFPHKLSKGYGPPAFKVVQSINQKPVKNLAGLVEILRDSTDEFLRFEFGGRGAEILVFPRKEMISATEGILNDNDVRSQGSPDAMAIWNAKPPK